MSPLPQPLRLVVFDLDGVIYRGTEPVPGAVELVRYLHDAGIGVRFATNNSMVARAGYVERLRSMGIAASLGEIVTSVTATVEHLRREAPEVRRVLAVGASGMLAELRDAALEAVPVGEAAPPDYDGGPLAERFDAVIAGLDPAFDYRRLAIAISAVRAGARFIATNVDKRFPTPGGFLPGAGTVVAAIATGSDRQAEVIGKPEPAMFEAILAAAGVPPDEAVVVGDNPDADVVAARRAGIASVLVLTGVADAAIAERLDGDRAPDLVLAGPGELTGLVAAQLSR
jgi:phosphoglycolate/pyridoxal phosphate phosphatase family enzyme